MSVKETTNRLARAIADLSNRYSPALITIIILACFFYYYFSVIVNTNEKELRERKFRGLHQVATSIRDKLENYEKKNARNFIERLKQAGKLQDTILTEKDFGLKFHKADNSNKNLSHSQGQEFEYIAGEKKFRFTPDTTGYATIDLKEFLAPLLRRDLFNKYLIAGESIIMLDELDLSRKSLTEYLSTTIVADTITRTRISESGHLIKTNIGGKDYRLFSLAFSVDGNKHFTLGGYLPDDEYEAERKYIPIYGILFLVIGVVSVILLIPLLRVFLMHRSEQLVTMTVSSAFAATHLLASVVILSIITFYVNLRIVRDQKDKILVELAGDIDNTLSSEIEAYRRALNLATSDAKRHGNFVNDSLPNLFDALIDKDSVVWIDQSGATKKTGKIDSQDSIMAYLTQLQWTDDTGKQRMRWTKDKVVPYKMKIEDRDYYRAVMDDKLFYDAYKEPYYFTDISSWVSNKNFAVVSMPIDIRLKGSETRLRVVSGGGRLRSVFSPILPYGYSFCVVNASGKVLFHKDDSRNLNENLLQEFSNRQAIRPVIVQRTPAFFNAKYAGSNHRFYSMPIYGTTYSLLTFRDLQLGWAEELDVISATSILVLFNLGVLLAAILVIRALSFSDSKSKMPSLAFTWLRPVRSLKREYISISAFFLICMGTQLLFTYLLRHIDNLTLVTSTFMYTYLMLVATFHLFAIKKDPHQHIFDKPKKIFAVLLAIPAICILLYGLKYGIVALWLFAEMLLYSLVYVFLTYKWKRISRVARTVLEETNTTWLKPGFRYAYTSFVWALITSGSVVPLLIFYLLCYDEQNKMSNRYAQWTFANQLSASPNKPFNNPEGNLRLTYRTPYHFGSIASNITRYKEEPIEVADKDPFTIFYKSIKPSFLYYNRNLEQLNSQNGANTEFAWKETTGEKHPALYFKQNISTKRTGLQGWKLSAPPSLDIKEHLPKLITLPNFLLISVLLASLYYLLTRLIRKIFFDGAMEPAFPVGLDLFNGRSAGVNGNLFIYGPPGTHKIKAAKKEILKHGSFVHIDFGDLAFKAPAMIIAEKEAELSLLPKHSTMLLFTNISHNPESATLTDHKLTILEHYQRLKHKMVIISSKYYESLGMFEYEPGSISFRSRWDNIMQSFYNVYHHWPRKQPDGLLFTKEEQISQFMSRSYSILGKEVPVVKPAPSTVYLPFPDNIHLHIMEEIQKLIRQIRSECSHTAFLYELTDAMINYASQIASPPVRKLESDSAWPASRIISRHFIVVFSKVCERIESLAANHYSSLWKAISPEEQKTLYDIALDELVNPFNRKTAIRLCEIGLIKPVEGLACYTIMNNSFRSYILNHVANYEITIFKKEIANKGFGSSIQLPLIIVAIGALIFIAFTQREAFTSFISYLGAGFAGITTLLKIISAIPDSKAAVKT